MTIVSDISVIDMIRGYLKITVLKELDLADLSGYELMARIGNIAGKKPSAGSTYPLLNELLEGGFIRCREDGRKKVYSLTAKGKKAIVVFSNERQECTLKHMEIIRSIGEITGKESIRPALKMMDFLKADELSIIRFIDIMSGLRSKVLELVSAEDYPKNEAKIKKIISSASKELDKIKGSKGGKR